MKKQAKPGKCPVSPERKKILDKMSMRQIELGLACGDLTPADKAYINGDY